MKTKILFDFLLLSFAFIFFTCDSTEPGKDTLSLTVEDVSSTEVWLKQTGKTDGEFIVERNNEEVKIITLTGTDNIIYEDSLQPSTTYTYQVNGSHAISNEITATTMDTTSHNFAWQTYTFGGQGGSSTLYDVAIIDENNIWAVGEIYTADDKYNAVHWDGNEWELIQIKWDGFLSQLRTIYAFDESDIWFGNLNLFHWNGIMFEQIDIPNEVFLERQNSIWGTSSTDLYVVGNGGNIAHYYNGEWQKIECGITNDIKDITGVQTDADGYIKYCAAGNTLLRIDENNILTKVSVENNTEINSVWGPSNRLVYVAGEAVLLYKNGQWEKTNDPEVNSIYRLKGADFNKIVGISAERTVLYYNGSKWHTIQPATNSIYLKVKIKKNTIAAVGWQNNAAAITILEKDY